LQRNQLGRQTAQKREDAIQSKTLQREAATKVPGKGLQVDRLNWELHGNAGATQ